jgi:hypothetical protein
MLWRPAYRTLVARDLVVPALPPNVLNPLPRPQVLVGGFDFLAYREMGIWKRLIASEEVHPDWRQVFLLSEPSDRDLQLLDSLVPTSDRERTFCVADTANDWRDLIAPDRPEQSFAAVLQGNQAPIMMKGTPTEEAWDAFRAELNVRG